MKKKTFLRAMLLLGCLTLTMPAMAQFNLKKAVSGL